MVNIKNNEKKFIKNEFEQNQFVQSIKINKNIFINFLKSCGENDIEELLKKEDFSFIQKIITNYSFESDEERDRIRVGFWAFFASYMMNLLGGKLIIAGKNDYNPNTPLLVDYGNSTDKKGNKKWIAISFDSWFNTILRDEFIGTLNETIEYIQRRYLI